MMVDSVVLAFFWQFTTVTCFVITLALCKKQGSGSSNMTQPVVAPTGSQTAISPANPEGAQPRLMTSDSLMNVACAKGSQSGKLDDFDSEKEIIVEDDALNRNKPPPASALTKTRKSLSMSMEECGTAKHVRIINVNPSTGNKVTAEASDMLPPVSPQPSEESRSPLKAMFNKLRAKRSGTSLRTRSTSATA